MESFEYITFDNDDIIEAIQDFYTKKTGRKIDIRFDESNVSSLRPLRSITIKNSLTTGIAKEENIEALSIRYEYEKVTESLNNQS
jgi:hypothetical protein